jgi:hypothetical protein
MVHEGNIARGDVHALLVYPLGRLSLQCPRPCLQPADSTPSIHLHAGSNSITEHTLKAHLCTQQGVVDV